MTELYVTVFGPFHVANENNKVAPHIVTIVNAIYRLCFKKKGQKAFPPHTHPFMPVNRPKNPIHHRLVFALEASVGRLLYLLTGDEMPAASPLQSTLLV